MPSRLRRRKRKPWGLTLVLLLVLIALTYATVRVYLRAPEQTADIPTITQPATPSSGSQDLSEEEAEVLRSHYERKPGFYTILVSGVDDGNGGSDTNILVAVDTENDYIYGVSIPRDTKASINGKNRKINFAYNSGGMELMAETVAHQLGIPVDYTVLVDLRAFQALVDTIGGVDFYIPVNMDYDDPYQNLSIHFSKGMRHLTGSEALKVVRFRHNNDGSGYPTADIGRISTQQEFLKAVAAQTLQLGNWDKIPALAKIFQQNVETDLELSNLVWLGEQALTMGTANIHFHTLPGDGAGWYKGGSYYVLEPEAVLELINASFNPYQRPLTLDDMDILVP